MPEITSYESKLYQIFGDVICKKYSGTKQVFDITCFYFLKFFLFCFCFGVIPCKLRAHSWLWSGITPGRSQGTRQGGRDQQGARKEPNCSVMALVHFFFNPFSWSPLLSLRSIFYFLGWGFFHFPFLFCFNRSHACKACAFLQSHWQAPPFRLKPFHLSHWPIYFLTFWLLSSSQSQNQHVVLKCKLPMG